MIPLLNIVATCCNAFNIEFQRCRESIKNPLNPILFPDIRRGQCSRSASRWWRTSTSRSDRWVWSWINSSDCDCNFPFMNLTVTVVSSLWYCRLAYSTWYFFTGARTMSHFRNTSRNWKPKTRNSFQKLPFQKQSFLKFCFLDFTFRNHLPPQHQHSFAASPQRRRSSVVVRSWGEEPTHFAHEFSLHLASLLGEAQGRCVEQVYWSHVCPVSVGDPCYCCCWKDAVRILGASKGQNGSVHWG